MQEEEMLQAKIACAWGPLNKTPSHEDCLPPVTAETETETLFEQSPGDVERSADADNNIS